MITCGLRSSVCCFIISIFSMQWRILFSSLVDKIEHTEAFELVEEEVANPEDKVPKKRGTP